jgi:hypothetical protein
LHTWPTKPVSNKDILYRSRFDEFIKKLEDLEVVETATAVPTEEATEDN